MNIKEQYKKETGKDWKMSCSTEQPTTDYVKWLEEAINYTRCCEELKGKEALTFWEWAALNKLETKSDEILYNEIWYYLPDLVRKYEREIKQSL